ncbi:vacuolar protein sorting-associated protein 18 dor isoform X2 [Leptinotarsa decemlineata]|uniref:vacuolar protein sorting-associated protein 18 dor isoform X2 n=1 Tax=Leptinotarsa decemlineata TaxID=7539 RepID=UPI000C253B0B|nr:vacuolar protein sorting-associated protein 18 homolog isoform X2 [Leptinotarsa decemlineata]
MTSMFDQFEQASLKTKSNISTAEMCTLGFINMSLEQEVPIFMKSKKDFIPSDRITHVAIANKNLAMVMANNVLFRMNLNNPQQYTEISLSKYTSTCRLTNLFLDPTGNHLLLTFAQKPSEGGPELLYLSKKSDKLRSTTKFRGNEFTEVAWNTENDSCTTTGPILLGTSKGLIFETEIVLEGDKFFTSSFSSSLEQYWRQVFDIGKGTNTPITGLEYYRIPSTDKYVIIAATPSRLYFFSGGANIEEKPVLQQVFNKYLNIPEHETFIECASNLRYSKLQFWSENLITPNAFAWISEKGISYSQFDLLTDDIKTIKSKINLIAYPKPLYEDYSVSQKYPIAIALTQFHILLAYSDSIKGICLLNQEVVYEDNYNEAFGKLVNIVKDVQTGEIWAVTENAVFRFKITKEERNVWQIFCNKGEFDLAKKYSRSNEACYNHVLIKEADMLFNEKKYILSAQRYAETQSSFEEICLKFIQADQQDALKLFLRSKLDTLKPQDKTQITMIVLWVLELYLSKLEEHRLQGLEQSAKYSDVQKEFEAFLALDEVSDCLRNNKNTIYDLMASHGDKANLMKLTIVNKDFEQLIRQHIFKNSFREALDVLKSQNNNELYYQFAPILIQEDPKHMVKAIIEQGRKLSPLKLLPAMVTCSGELHAFEVIKYLEFCIEKMRNTDKAIHNFLLSLYAKYDSEKLMNYLNSQGQEISMVNYDVHFALRLCHENNQKRACVQLFGLLGLWESAVDLALTVELDLAKKVANMSPEDDLELRKKLWLKIAHNVVKDKDNIEEAMHFLRQCDLIKIEDILPFFPDFVTIDHFKDAICNSLKEYNQNIQNIKDEMEEATKSAEQVRDEIQSFRNHFTLINNTDACEICNITLMIKPFYMFPCHHKFHSDCLLSELSPFLGPAKKNRLSDLERQLKILNNQSNADSISTGSTGMSAKDLVKSEIDNILGSECVYCGENMIRNIDKPFIEDYEHENIMREWE